MLTSKWRARLHPYLGTIQVPIVDLEIRGNGGEYHPFSLCVDSGAVVSLLPRFAAEMLGLNFSTGRSISLGGVGKQPLDAMIHELGVRLPGLPEIEIPVAIAVGENAPGLLGRLGVFSRFEITFDSLKCETRIRLP